MTGSQGRDEAIGTRRVSGSLEGEDHTSAVTQEKKPAEGFAEDGV